LPKLRIVKTNFGILDAIIIFAYLAMLTGIGIYFSRRTKNLDEYFLAGRTMGWLPIGMSLMAALNSGIDYVMQPSWVIIYGLVGTVTVLSWFFLYPWTAYVTVPFYRRLNVLSAYEYLETRFDGKVRTLAACIFLLWRIGWMATAIYVPSLMLSTMSGGMFSTSVLVIVLGFVLTLYTMLGGIKAVIWTEVIQFCVMLAGLAIMMGVVIYHVKGGIPAIWQTAAEGGRTAFLTTIPGFSEAGFFEKIRMYFAEPRTAIGLFIAVVAGRMATYTGDQVMVQRFQTTKSVKDARQGFIINALGDSVWTLGLSFVGLGLFAFYQVNAKPADLPTDRTVPYFLATMFPTGILGLVLAATLAASLASIASAINSCTTITMVDFYERLIKRRSRIPAEVAQDTQETGRKEVVLSRITTVVFGMIGVVLAANVSHVGNLIEIAQKVINTFTGPLLGIYLLGMFTRTGNSAGALLGGILGTATGIVVAFFLKDEQGKDLIAFLWPSVFGLVITVVAGYVCSIIISALTGTRSSEQGKQQLTWWNVMKRPIVDGGPPSSTPQSTPSHST
jgi:solute carrier family 5 (sodium-coupled monocarboxylate transporter), member 8/12